MQEQVEIPDFLACIGSAVSATLVSSVHHTFGSPETPDESANAPATGKANVIGPRGVHRLSRLLLQYPEMKLGIIF